MKIDQYIKRQNSMSFKGVTTLSIALYYKRDYFSFAIVKFSFLCNNIPLSPAYVCVFPS
jgi:hypothetical protein